MELTLAQKNLKREQLLEQIHRWLTGDILYETPEVRQNNALLFAREIERLR